MGLGVDHFLSGLSIAVNASIHQGSQRVEPSAVLRRAHEQGYEPVERFHVASAYHRYDRRPAKVFALYGCE